MTRRFSGSQRAALFIAADGNCERCGEELPDGWHADHVTPWSKGGQTHMPNGQALCPPCNLRKGNQMTDLSGLRPWQVNAINRYFAENPKDWTVGATPGSGKTRFSLALAQMLLEQGTVERVVVVVPSDTLREQWADNSVIPLFPVRNKEGTERDKPGYKGGVFTYQALATGALADLQARNCRTPTLVIFDEIHHAGDGRSWCGALERAFGSATRRLMLTGTPWRRDDNRIPFVEYRPNPETQVDEVRVDFAYTYGEAVRDEVCRAIEFHAYTGDAKWADCGKVVTASLGPDLSDEDLSTTLDILFDPDKPWIPTMLQRVTRALDELREDVPNAGGLVIAEGQPRARRYAAILEELTGEAPTLVISDDLEANAKLEAYRDCPQCRNANIKDAGLCRHPRPKWLVAVRKVSEGVDIPRLSVGLYAAKITTPLFFQQCAGRFVRRAKTDEHNAMLFIPTVPDLMAHARKIELMLRHEVEVAREELERAKRELTARQLALDLDPLTPLGSSEAEFDRAIFRNRDYTIDDLSDVLDDMRSAGIPEVYAVAVASILSGRRVHRPDAETVPETLIPPEIAKPRHRLERGLRSEIEDMSRKIAAMTGLENKAVNGQLRKRFGPRRDAPLEVLEEIHDYCVKWLGDL